MTQLYWGSTADFVERATLNTIAETLRQAFFDHLGYNPSESEQRSWRNSLRALATAVQRGGFTDQGMFLEYLLPLSSRRLDAMITGLDHEGRPNAVIVELEQWSDCEPTDVEELVVDREATVAAEYEPCVLGTTLRVSTLSQESLLAAARSTATCVLERGQLRSESRDLLCSLIGSTTSKI
jgi:hypothetical protein